MAILTFAQAKAQVAKVQGRSSDADLLTEAGEEIQRVFEELNLWDLEFLRTSQNVSVLMGTQDYNLNANARKIYSVRLVNGTRPIAYLEQRDWDRIALDQTEAGTIQAYTLIRSSNTQVQLRFFPIPAEADTAVVLYYRLLTSPSVDGDALDIIERYQTWIIYQSRSNILAAHGDIERASYWQERADRMYRKLRQEDFDAPDRLADLRPGATSPWFPSDHPSNYLRDFSPY